MSGTLDRIDVETCPFERPLTAKRLKPAVTAEPPRLGEGGRPCPICAAPDEAYLWANRRWRLRHKDPTPFRGTAILETRDHHDSFADLPAECLSELGPLIAAIERAILGLGGVGRVHVSRWGDGNSHFHLHFYARPYGRTQLRGTFLAIWELFLPALPAEEITEAGRRIAERLPR